MRDKIRHLRTLLYFPGEHHLNLPVRIVLVQPVDKHKTNRLAHRRTYPLLRGAPAFDGRQERQSANRRAAKELLGIVLATAGQLPPSMRTFLKAVDLFREPAIMCNKNMRTSG